MWLMKAKETERVGVGNAIAISDGTERGLELEPIAQVDRSRKRTGSVSTPLGQTRMMLGLQRKV